jgi:membrane-associated protein
MKRITGLVFSFVIAYSVLFVLSVLFIVPRYLSGRLGDFLLALLMDTEPEGRLLTSFYSPLFWLVIPLTSIGFCVISMVTYSVSTRSAKPLRRLGQFGGVLFFAASFLPAVLVVRELLVYRVRGVALPGFVSVLDSFVHVLKDIINPTLLLGHGAWAVPIIIFVETGLFFGFFLPGDSLLLTVGVLGAVGYVDLTSLIPSSIAAAIMGDQLGYAIGRRSGEALARRFRFVRENVERASVFYDRHGGKAVVLARFVPVVRTFAPIVAGAAGMSYSRFTLSNIVGGALWVVSIALAGYFVGRQVPVVANYLNPIIIVVVISSPLVWMLAWVWGRSRKVNVPTG